MSCGSIRTLVGSDILLSSVVVAVPLCTAMDFVLLKCAEYSLSLISRLLLLLSGFHAAHFSRAGHADVCSFCRVYM